MWYPPTSLADLLIVSLGWYTDRRHRLVAQIAFVFQGRSGGVECITVKFSVLFELDTFRQYLYCLFAYIYDVDALFQNQWCLFMGPLKTHCLKHELVTKYKTEP